MKIEIIEILPVIDTNGKRVRCKCFCGKEFITRKTSVITGNTKSCGCYRNKKSGERLKVQNTTHGLSKTKYHSVWRKMKERCYNPNHKAYHRYGGRGIEVCDEWKNNAQAFCQWLECQGYKEGLQLDRIDNDGNYSPANCRVTTCKINSRNSSSTKLKEKDILEIRVLLKEGNLTRKKIGEKFNVSRQTINDINANKTWQD